MILVIISISGCGKSEPSGVAVEYIKAISEGKIDKAKEITVPTNRDLKKVIATCEKRK